jgi:hypothetical protein
MPFLTTSSGRKIRVWLHHTVEENQVKPRRITKAFFSTDVEAKNPSPEIEVFSRCNPNDAFNKFVGRSVATKRLVKVLHDQVNWLNANDRKQIVETLCPEFCKEPIKVVA